MSWLSFQEDAHTLAISYWRMKLLLPLPLSFYLPSHSLQPGFAKILDQFISCKPCKEHWARKLADFLLKKSRGSCAETWQIRPPTLPPSKSVPKTLPFCTLDILSIGCIGFLLHRSLSCVPLFPSPLKENGGLILDFRKEEGVPYPGAVA